MALASITAAVSNQVATAAFWNNTINAILNQLNGNLDDENIRDGSITAALLANNAVDLSGAKVTGNLPVANLNSGTDASATTFWRGDATWAGVAQPISWSFLNLKVTRPSAATVTVTADELIIAASATTLVKEASVSVTPDITASGANGLDTGAEAANTIYYVWVIRKSSDGTVAGLLSTSATSPTLPTGYDQKALVSAAGNDNSSDFIDFTQNGKHYFFTVWPQIIGSDVSGTWQAIDLTPSTLSYFVPPALSTYCFGSIWEASGLAMANDNSVSATASTIAANKYNPAATSGTHWEFDVITADTIYYSSDSTSNKAFLHGFILNKL